MPDKIQEAINVIKSGDKVTGKQLLIEILREDRRNETAWLWMTQVLDSNDDRVKCLQNVLNINPDNEIAKRGLARLQTKEQVQSAPKPSPQIGQQSTTTITELLESIVSALDTLGGRNLLIGGIAGVILVCCCFSCALALVGRPSGQDRPAPPVAPAATLEVPTAALPTKAPPTSTATRVVPSTGTPTADAIRSIPTKPQPTKPRSEAVCSCSGNIYNCDDFNSHASAQACFNYCKSIGQGDVHKLDRDNDGSACESLP